METHNLSFPTLQIRALVEEVMTVTEAVRGTAGIIFRGTVRGDTGNAYSRLKKQLEPLQLAPTFRRRGAHHEIGILPAARVRPSNPLINLLLFLCTAGSTLLVGAMMEGVDPTASPTAIFAGIPFAASILCILATHEFGHYFVSRYHGVQATLPYFIPAPTLFGTLGAVIKTKSPMPGRAALLDIGAAGPICGFVLSVIALTIGLARATVVEIQPLLRTGALEFGDSLLVAGLVHLLKGPLPEEYTVLLGPVGFAGWVGLLVTAFNLMPIGQLDGGHIIYALLGRRHLLVARLATGALLLMGFVWPGWWVWAALVIVLGPGHPPPLNDVTPLDRRRRIIAMFSMAIFILCFIPVPVKFI